MDARTCDECGRIGHAPYYGWLRVTESTDIEMFGQRSMNRDACSVSCLARTCAKELAGAERAGVDNAAPSAPASFVAGMVAQ